MDAKVGPECHAAIVESMAVFAAKVRSLHDAIGTSVLVKDVRAGVVSSHPFLFFTQN
jgi:hypothetical protein